VHCRPLVHRDDGFWRRRAVAQCTVWSTARRVLLARSREGLGVVVLPPVFDDDLSFFERIKYLTVEQLVAHSSVEAFAISVLPRAAWLNECGLCSDSSNPVSDGLCDELRAIVRTNIGRGVAQNEQVGQSINYLQGIQLPFYPDRQTFPAVRLSFTCQPASRSSAAILR